MSESPEIRRRKPHRSRPTADAAIDAIRAAKGLLSVAAEMIGSSRTTLQTMARGNRGSAERCGKSGRNWAISASSACLS